MDRLVLIFKCMETFLFKPVYKLYKALTNGLRVGHISAYLDARDAITSNALTGTNFSSNIMLLMHFVLI